MNDTAHALVRRLAEQPIVPLTDEEWTAVADQFEELERHSTFINGDLIVIRLDSSFAAVEQPTPGKKVIRHLADSEEARRFFEQRLDEYERMWDGCGCKIDYYS